MKFDKPHSEFTRVSMQQGWELPDGYEPGCGVEQRILSGRLDEASGQGFRTRLLRFPPKFYTREPFVHDYWEEVFLISGDLWVGNDAQGRGGERFEAHTYACRPPGTPHGPFRSQGGCLLLELHYYGSGQ